VGAGTVLSVADVRAAADAGAHLIVSPNMNTDVIRETRRLGLASVPGVFTPSEAFAAIDAGGSALYKPGKQLTETGNDAAAFVDAYRQATAAL
jgi:2-dehydro-3-deoxyphosphogalactonate aldolase